MLIRMSVAAVLALATSLPQAASFAQPVTVTLSAPGGLWDGTAITEPGPITESDSLAPDASILPGDDTIIGGEFLLPSEFISLVGTEIHIRLAQGSSDGGTGYLGAAGVPATYTFSGLSVTGQNIVGRTHRTRKRFLGDGLIQESSPQLHPGQHIAHRRGALQESPPEMQTHLARHEPAKPGL